jgi:tRNA(Arg) A34 adenosine deaminase TadA
MNNEEYIMETIRISESNMEDGGGPFGAIIVKDNEIIARAGNTVTSSNDPTAHAEINAIRKASQYLENFDLSGCILYSSCEPCPMCLGAIYWARLDGIYFAAGKEDAKDAGFDDSFIYREIKKPFDRRSIQTTQMIRDEAYEVLKKWKQKEDKIQY